MTLSLHHDVIFILCCKCVCALLCQLSHLITYSLLVHTWMQSCLHFSFNVLVSPVVYANEVRTDCYALFEDRIFLLVEVLLLLAMRLKQIWL